MMRLTSYRQSQGRRGAALIAVVVTLAFLTFLLVTIARQNLAHRGFLKQREQQLQSDWLARAGIELAASRLLDDATYSGETVAIVADSEVRIAVRNERVPADLFRITCEARFPSNAPGGVARSATRQFRRVIRDGEARLEAVK